MAQHPREHVVRQQADVVGEHAEHQPVDEVRDPLRVVAALSQCLGHRRQGSGGALRERLPGLARPQPLGVGERALEPIARRRVGEVVKAELIGLADAVRPVGADAEPQHVGDDQQRRILQRQGVLPELPECSVQVGAVALVLPGEVVALPDVGPAVAAGVLAGATLEAVGVAGRVGLGRGRLAEQAAQVDEVLLGGGALLEFGGPPLFDEPVGRHAIVRLRLWSPLGVRGFTRVLKTGGQDPCGTGGAAPAGAGRPWAPSGSP